MIQTCVCDMAVPKECSPSEHVIEMTIEQKESKEHKGEEARGANYEDM